MDTRSLIYFKDSKGKIYVVIHQQFNGFPDNVGSLLAVFLLNITKSEYPFYKKPCHGFGDVVARYITQKSHENGFEILPSDTSPNTKYNYTVTYHSLEEITVSFNDGDEMSVKDFEKYCEKYRETL